MHGEGTNVAQFLRRVQLHIVSIEVPARTPKSQCSSLKAEWRWTQESEGGGASQTRDSVLARRMSVSSVFDQDNHNNEGHVAWKAGEWTQDKV